MLVYGDPRYVISGAEARGRLRGFYDRAASGSIDAARDLVIALGQVEQGLADLANMQAKDESLTTLMEACDAAAERFVAKVLKKDSSADTPQRNKAALQGLDGLDAIGELEIKIPEGFAFYSLYPEQYVAAAESFTSRRSITPTLVVGIRSIGTTLSATVKAALAARGFPVERITVRPGGHPFARKTEIDTAPNAEAVIIVDEGPGLSGSSMASAAAAFRERGLTDITFFPSHAKPPGASASEETRRIWSETPCIVMPLLDGDPGSGPVMAALRHETEHLLGAPVCSVEDLSAGAWTRHVASGKAARSAPQFERSKFLIRCGKGRGVLWKYAGLGPGEKLESFVTSSVARQNALAAKSWCSPALGEHFGFVATEWREGRGLATDLLHDSIPGRIAQYISDVSKPPLALEICHDGIERLREMTRCNLAEAGLKNLCARLDGLGPGVDRLSKLPASGDGRLAPHEWIYDGERLLKTDVWGHDSDHTVIGPQPVLWDVAGAIVEWDIPGDSTFLSSLATVGITVQASDLLFYQLSYLAFRIGVCSFAGDSEGIVHYKAKVERLLCATAI